jgi:hypothetical protein
MPIFGRYTPVTIVRDAGTEQETRWNTHAGGDLRHKVLFDKVDSVKTGDQILCGLFDEPRVVTRVDADLALDGVACWEATVLPRSEWDRIHRRPPVAPAAGPDPGADSGRAESALRGSRSTVPSGPAATEPNAVAPGAKAQSKLPRSLGSPEAVKTVIEHITKRELNYESFAKKVPTSGRTIQSFVSTGKIRRDLFNAIAAVLGLSIEDLLEGKAPSR